MKIILLFIALFAQSFAHYRDDVNTLVKQSHKEREYQGDVEQFLEDSKNAAVKQAKKINRNFAITAGDNFYRDRVDLQSKKQKKTPITKNLGNSRGRAPVQKKPNGFNAPKQGTRCTTKSCGGYSTGFTPKADKNRFFIFVTLTMPEQSLKRYFAAAQKIGARLVIRGLLNNNMLATVERIKGYGINVSIDPDLFTRFGVSRAPTFIHTEIKDDGEYGEYDKLLGHVPLIEALEMFANIGKVAGIVSFQGKLEGKL